MRIAINGFGRIGRITLRAIVEKNKKLSKRKQIEVVAINDLADSKTLAHLFKYDSVHRTFNGRVSSTSKSISVNGHRIRVFGERDPKALPWKELDIDLVIESTGIFRTRELAGQHLTAGAKKVVISAPAKSPDMKTIVMGINDKTLRKSDKIFSNASCTTNCAAPMVQVLQKKLGVKSGYITTIHSYTGDQRIHDAPHRDLRRARAAAVSIVPTTTGAAKAITKIFPELEGNFGGCGIRVPVPDGSLTDITCIVKKKTTVEEVNKMFKQAADKQLKDYLDYIDEPLVSSDIIGNPYSCVFDSLLTSVIGNMVKVVGWYDNEAGYSNRLVDLIVKVNNF